MKIYKDLNMKKIREDNGLDFAHYTYLPGQCTCCYGPMDMPARYWRNSLKPLKVFDINSYELDGNLLDENRLKSMLDSLKSILDVPDEKLDSILYVPYGRIIDEDSLKCILFANANNTSGTVKKNDEIEDYTCVEYTENLFGEPLEKICRDLAEQLDEDYVVVVPKSADTCIMIRIPDDIPSWQKEKGELARMRQEKVKSGAVIAWEE